MLITGLVKAGFDLEDIEKMPYPIVCSSLEAVKKLDEADFEKNIYSTYIGSQCDAQAYFKRKKYKNIETVKDEIEGVN